MMMTSGCACAAGILVRTWVLSAHSEEGEHPFVAESWF